MSTSVVAQNSALFASEAVDTDLAGTVLAVKASAAAVYQVEIDNTANTSAASYVKLWDVASGSVTLGSTAPASVLVAPAATKICYTFPPGFGLVFGTAVSWACVTTGGTAGTTSPTNDVIVRMSFA